MAMIAMMITVNFQHDKYSCENDDDYKMKMIMITGTFQHYGYIIVAILFPQQREPLKNMLLPNILDSVTRCFSLK